MKQEVGAPFLGTSSITKRGPFFLKEAEARRLKEPELHAQPEAHPDSGYLLLMNWSQTEGWENNTLIEVNGRKLP